VQQAEILVDQGVHQFSQWLEKRGSVPLVQALLRQSQDWGTLELQRARRALARGEAVDQVMAQLACGLTRKLMHGTLAGLHHSSGAEHQAWVQTAQRCFLGEPAADPVPPHGHH